MDTSRQTTISDYCPCLKIIIFYWNLACSQIQAFCFYTDFRRLYDFFRLNPELFLCIYAMNLIQKTILILREVDKSYAWFFLTSHSVFAGFDMVVTLLSLATQGLSFGCISVIVVYISELFPTFVRQLAGGLAASCGSLATIGASFAGVPMVRLSVTVTTVVTWSISSQLHTK